MGLLNGLRSPHIVLVLDFHRLVGFHLKIMSLYEFCRIKPFKKSKICLPPRSLLNCFSKPINNGYMHACSHSFKRIPRLL